MNSIIKTRIEEINSGKVPSEYKKTKVGIFPIEWEENTLGAIFKERKEVNCANLELLSITGEKGVIPRTEIEGKDNSSDDKSKYKKKILGVEVLGNRYDIPRIVEEKEVDYIQGFYFTKPLKESDLLIFLKEHNK